MSNQYGVNCLDNTLIYIYTISSKHHILYDK